MTTQAEARYRSLNGIAVKRTESTVFIPLPREMWIEIGSACRCEHCARRGPGVPAYWDTLAIGTAKNAPFTWTVHAPELHPKPRECFESVNELGHICELDHGHAGPHRVI